MHKVWLNLRRVIAIGELIGLPRAARMIQMQNNLNPSPGQVLHVKASLWTSLCSIDRIAGVLGNFPCAATRNPSAADQPLVIDGAVQPRVYMLRLSNIATQVQDLDDLSMDYVSEAEVYRSVLHIDNELRLLANETPRQWWVALPSDAEPAHLLQLVHYVLAVRTHLVFMMRRDVQGLYSHSQQAGLEACCEVLQRWQIMRRSLPLGFFLCRMIDLQAFTAAVVALLASENARITHRPLVAGNGVGLSECVAQTVELLHEKARDPVGSDVARQALQAIQSLAAMLQGQGNASEGGYLKLTVPRLGKIHVRRNHDINQKGLGMAEGIPRQAQQWPSASRVATQAEPPMDAAAAVDSTQMQDLWSQGPFSWFIEDDCGAMFEDISPDLDFLLSTR